MIDVIMKRFYFTAEFSGMDAGILEAIAGLMMRSEGARLSYGEKPSAEADGKGTKEERVEWVAVEAGSAVAGQARNDGSVRDWTPEERAERRRRERQYHGMLKDKFTCF
jgi:hypothetical protein